MKQIGIQLNDHNDTGDVLDLKIEPKRDSAGKIISGLVVGATLEQNIALLFLAQKGELKANPDLGVGLEDISLSQDYLAYRHKIKEELKKDGMIVHQLEFYANKPFKIVASYEK